MSWIRTWFLAFACLGGAFAYFLFWAAQWGFTLAHAHPDQRPHFLEEHESYIRWSSWTLLVLICFLVIGEAFFLKGIPHAGLFWFHITCGLLFVPLFLAIKIRWNGNRSPKIHRLLVYPCLLLAAIVLFTGGIFLWQLNELRHLF